MPRPRWLKSKLPGASGNKYGAKTVMLDGYRFASQREAKVYSETVLRVRAGELTHLEIHPVYPLIVNGVKVGRFTADLQYRDAKTGILEIVDVKSKPTAAGEAFRLRVKLWRACYPGLKLTIVL